MLVSVDGEALRKMPQETVRSAIRGVAGTEVVLGLMREGAGGRSVMIQVPLVRGDAKKAEPHAVSLGTQESSAVPYEGVDRASVAYVEAERTRELEERVERQREEMRRKEVERRRQQQQAAEEARLRCVSLCFEMMLKTAEC